MSLLPKIVRGSAMHVLEQIVRLGCALWITPRMVHHLGEAGFGLWGLLSGLFAQFILLDLGLCTSLPRFLSRSIGRNDLDDLRTTASTGAVGMVVIGLAAQLAGVIIWFSLPHFLSEVHTLSEARAVVVALMLATLAYWIQRPIALHLQSRLRRDLMSVAAITRVLVCTPLVAWALADGKGLEQVAWIHTFGAIGELALCCLFGRSFFGLARWRWASRAKAWDLLRFACWSYLLTTTERIRSSFAGADIYILAAMLGTAASGVYSLGQKLSFMFYEVAYSIVGAQLLSTFSHMDGAGDESGLRHGFVAASRISVLMSVIGGGILWSIGPGFLARWVPGQAAEATPVLLALILPQMLAAAQIPSRHLLISLDKHRPLALTYLVGIVVNVILTLVLVRAMGMVGAAVATLVEMTFVYALAMPWLVATQARLGLRMVAWRCLWRPFLRALLLLAPGFYVARQWLSVQPTYGQIVLAVAGLSLLFFTALGLGLLGREERGWLKLGLQALFTRANPSVRDPLPPA